MPDPILTKLDAISEDLQEVKSDLRPVREFYLQAKGVLSVIKWIGFAGLLGIAVFAVRAIGL